MKEGCVKRTFKDKMISGINACYYRLAEPLMLGFVRLKHESKYLKNESEPLISVYIPTYNRAELLTQRSVPSVLAQNYKNFELIIIGDHCTDNTEELVLKIKDKRIIFFNLPSREYRYPPTVENHWLAGPVAAANIGLRMAKGSWVARLDDDDIWTSDHLESLLSFARAGNYEFASAQIYEERYGRREIVDGNEAQGKYYNRTKKIIRGYNPKIGSTNTWLYRSYLKFFKYNMNCWRKSWNRVNDTDISYRMFKAGVRMGFLARPLTLYLPRPGESTVGLDAYKNSAEKMAEHFKFQN